MPRKTTKAPKVKAAQRLAQEIARGRTAAEPAASETPTIPFAPPATTPATAKRAKTTPPEARAKMSALDAAAKVLADTGEPMTTGALIEAMAARGEWSSPAGKTPAATLSSAIQREIATKGDAARFTKTGRGLYARKA